MTFTCTILFPSKNQGTSYLLFNDHVPEVVEADGFWSLCGNKGLAAAHEDNPAGVDVVCFTLSLEDLGNQGDAVVIKWN